MDEPLGRHNGTVQGVCYFTADERCGVFVTESKIKKIYNDPLRTSTLDLSDKGQTQGHVHFDLEKETSVDGPVANRRSLSQRNNKVGYGQKYFI